MSKFSFKKIVAGALIISIIGGNVLAIQPRKADAQWMVLDAANGVQNVAIIASLGTLVGLSTSKNLKDFTLDALAYMIAKQFARAITTSVVNWINSGFEGNPSFLTDPAGFFADIGDQVTGAFIASTGVLSNLCSPFSIDVRIALALKYRPLNRQRYACTITTVINNSVNAVKNASLNGFTAGDFRQGGWPAFVSLTTEPQNNIYGAYLQAESDISFQIGQKQDRARTELNQGRGFLSWKTCRDNGDEASINARRDQAASDAGSEDRYFADLAVKENQTCETKTPGSVIASSLENNLGSGLRQLELADSLNEIVNALVAQLVTQVLTAGLSTVSGRGASDTSAYLNQLQRQQDTVQLENIRSKMLETLGIYITKAQTIKANRDSAVSAYLDARASLDTAKKCYVDKITLYSTQGGPNRAFLIQNAQQKIAEIDAIITGQFAPTASVLFQKAAVADGMLNSLLTTRLVAQNAKTATELNAVSQNLSQAIQDQALNDPQIITQRLPNDNDVTASQNDLTEAQTAATAIKTNALDRLRSCQALP